MMRTLLTLLVLLCIIIGPLANVSGSDECYGPKEPWRSQFSEQSETDVLRAQQYWESLCHELKAGSPDDWSGTYVGGYGMTGDFELHWAPQSGFLVLWFGCSPGVLDVNFGRVRTTSVGISLTPEVTKRQAWNQTMEDELVFVRWGQQRYLIRPSRIEAFCRYTAGLLINETSDWDGTVLMNVADSSKPTADLPLVPERYRKFLRSPITASITAVDEPIVRAMPDAPSQSEYLTRVRIDKGSKDGVVRGLQLRAGTWHIGKTLVVTHVEGHASIAECVTYFAERDDTEVNPRLRVGLTVTSRP